MVSSMITGRVIKDEAEIATRSEIMNDNEHCAKEFGFNFVLKTVNYK